MDIHGDAGAVIDDADALVRLEADFDVVAAAQGRDRRSLCAVLQAGRGRICTAIYRWHDGGWRAKDDPRLTTWPALVEETTSPTLFCGEIDSVGADALGALGELGVLLPAATRLRRAAFLAEIAWQRLNRNETDDPATLATSTSSIPRDDPTPALHHPPDGAKRRPDSGRH